MCTTCLVQRLDSAHDSVMGTRTGEAGWGRYWRSATVALIVASIASSWILGCSLQDRACTLIGCWDTVSLRGNIPSEARALAVRVCQGDACQEVELNLHVASDGTDPGACVALSSQSTGSVCALSTTSSVRRIQAQIELKPDGGTNYSLTVLDRASNETLLDGSGVPTFTESYPNGKECDLTPCRSGTLDIE